MGFHFRHRAKGADRLLIVLILFELGLVLVYALQTLLETSGWAHQLFDLDGEAGIPSWFSSVQLFSVGMLFLFSSRWPQRYRLANPRFLWVVAAGFIFLSMDETAQLHEHITTTLKHIAWLPKFKGGHGVWIPVYFSIAAALVASGRHTIRSMRKVYPRQQKIMFAGMMVCLLGGVGVEILGYWLLEGMEHSVLYKAEVALEEFLEMAGVSVVLYGAMLCAFRDHEVIGAEMPLSPRHGSHRATSGSNRRAPAVSQTAVAPVAHTRDNAPGDSI